MVSPLEGASGLKQPHTWAFITPKRSSHFTLHLGDSINLTSHVGTPFSRVGHVP